MQFSWTALSSTWTSSTSAFGTGNDNVYYALQYLNGATWTDMTTESFNNALSFSVSMPDARFAYGSAYSFRITPKNSCGISAATQPTTSYTIKHSAPTYMNAPTLVSS